MDQPISPAPDSPQPLASDGERDACAIVRRLRDAGHVAYFAGGCVRDLLLGSAPKDYDVATDAAPDRVRSLFSNTQAVGQAFGVILVRVGRSVIEVATFRAEGEYQDGRRPSSVRFTTAEEDAQRRDFTINGLFFDPLSRQVLDFVGGQADLAARRLRAIGAADARFAEDHLRLLRAVRFAARFSLEIEPDTAAPLRRRAPLLKSISPERIAQELRLMLMPATRTIAWPMLWDFGLGPVIFRFLNDGPPASFDAARSLLPRLTPTQALPFGVALAAAIACIGWQRTCDAAAFFSPTGAGAAASAMRQALRLSNEELDELRDTLVGAGLALGQTPLDPVARAKRFLARPTAVWSRRLLETADTLTDQFRPELAHRRALWDSLAGTDVAPPPVITGADLLTAGLAAGPKFKRLLDAAYDEQLANRLPDRESALAWALAQWDGI